jgi:hypothetical protein
MTPMGTAFGNIFGRSAFPQLNRRWIAMRKFMMAVLVLGVAATTAQAADETGKKPAGAAKGAAVGAVAGHEVGSGHAVAGAAAGAAIGHHQSKKAGETGGK